VFSNRCSVLDALIRSGLPRVQCTDSLASCRVYCVFDSPSKYKRNRNTSRLMAGERFVFLKKTFSGYSASVLRCIRRDQVDAIGMCRVSYALDSS